GAIDPASDKLGGPSGIPHAHLRKLHALSCVLDRADDRVERRRALDRPVAVLQPQPVPAGVTSLETWARRNRLDPARVKRINPAFARGRITTGKRPALVLAPVAPRSEERRVGKGCGCEGSAHL